MQYLLFPRVVRRHIRDDGPIGSRLLYGGYSANVWISINVCSHDFPGITSEDDINIIAHHTWRLIRNCAQSADISLGLGLVLGCRADHSLTTVKLLHLMYLRHRTSYERHIPSAHACAAHVSAY